MKHFKIQNLSALEAFVIEHKDQFDTPRCFAFKGEMGSGKTTLIQLLLKAFGIKDLQGSPTYAIVNQYYNETTHKEYYHLDCYRIKNDFEAFDLGLEELFNEKKTIFIEWPENVRQFLPNETAWITIHHESDGTRTIDITYEY
tara:strand:- start:607 stop:1035 length:429 start_codon:yes stop_codon:yes gene_type:complete